MGHPEFKVALGEKLDPDKWSAKKLSRICNNCTYLGVCGGGCLNILLLYPPKRREEYCELKKKFFNIVKNGVPTIKEYLEKGKISHEMLFTKIASAPYFEGSP